MLLALRVQQENDAAATVGTVELLKYLTRQAMKILDKQQTEKTMSFRCAAYNEASTEAEWFQLFESVLASIPGQVYIVVDLEILDKTFNSEDGFSWTQAFERFFSDLEARGLSTKVKVLFVSYGSLPFQISAAERSKFVISAKAHIIPARQRRAARSQGSQQVSLRLKNLPSTGGRGGRGRGRGRV